MLIHLRVSLPDRPGLLAGVSWALARAGADIVSVTVLDREGGRAVDDFYVTWPPDRSVGRLAAAVTARPGVTVLGARDATQRPAPQADLFLVGQLSADPSRGLETLVHTVPHVMSADWAAYVAPDGTVLRSLDAPAQLPASARAVPRPVTVNQPAHAPLAMAPIAGGVLLLGRTERPGFHRAELAHLGALLAVAAQVLHLPAAQAMSNG